MVHILLNYLIDLKLYLLKNNFEITGDENGCFPNPAPSSTFFFFFPFPGER